MNLYLANIRTKIHVKFPCYLQRRKCNQYRGIFIKIVQFALSINGSHLSEPISKREFQINMTNNFRDNVSQMHSNTYDNITSYFISRASIFVTNMMRISGYYSITVL